MYTKQKIDEFVENFVKRHIEVTKTHALKQHVLHEKEFIALCEKDVFPQIEENFQTSLKAEMAEITSSYESKQKQLHLRETQELEQKKNDRRQDMEWLQRDKQTCSQTIMALQSHLLENSTKRTEAVLNYNRLQEQQADPNHHGRVSQSDGHTHGRETDANSHQHGRQSGPDLSEFDKVERDLKSKLEKQQQKLRSTEQSISLLSVEIRQLEDDITAIQLRERTYTANNNLHDYLNKTLRGQYNDACKKTGRELDRQKQLLQGRVKEICHGMLLAKLRTHLNEEKKLNSLDEQQTRLLGLVEEMFERKATIARLSGQLKEMLSSHRSEQSKFEKIVQSASGLHQEQKLKRNQLEHKIIENERFLIEIPGKIVQLQEANSLLQREAQTLQAETSQFEQTASEAKSKYEKANKIAMPIVYAGGAVAVVGVVTLLLSAIPWLTIAGMTALALGGLSAVVAEGVNLGYSFNASRKQSALDSHNDNIQNKQGEQQDNIKKIGSLESNQETLPSTIRDDKLLLESEDQELQRRFELLEKERQQLYQLVEKHQQAEEQLEHEIRELREKPFEEGLSVRDFSFFAAKSTVVSTAPSDTLTMSHS